MWQKHQYAAEQRGIRAKINHGESPRKSAGSRFWRWSPEGRWPPLINKELISEETQSSAAGRHKCTVGIAQAVSRRRHQTADSSLSEVQVQRKTLLGFPEIRLFVLQSCSYLHQIPRSEFEANFPKVCLKFRWHFTEARLMTTTERKLSANSLRNHSLLI